MSPTPVTGRPTLEAPIREQALKQLASETMPSSNTAHAVNAATKAMEEALVLVKMLPSSLGGSERDTAAMEGNCADAQPGQCLAGGVDGPAAGKGGECFSWLYGDVAAAAAAPKHSYSYLQAGQLLDCT